MSGLFERFEFGGIDLKNRIVRSATMENMINPDAQPTHEVLEVYRRLAIGEVGLIITSSTRTNRDWQWKPGASNMCLDKDESIPAFSSIPSIIHAHGSKVAMQFGSFMAFDGDLVSPSGITYPWAPDATARALTAEEIGVIVRSYGEAGGRACRAGFDAVQIHAAHGYPLCSFLSPLFNRRDDRYGGNTENRTRIVLEIAAAIKENAGQDFPVFIKINVADFCNGGMVIDDAVESAKLMADNGIAAIETSGGMFGHDMTPLGPAEASDWAEGYFMDYASALKAAVDIPVILVGGLRDFTMIEAVLDQGRADLVSMSRPFIREPELIKRWMDGDPEPSHCVSCNGCMDLYKDGETVHCIIM